MKGLEMTVVDLSISKKEEMANYSDLLGDRIRDEAKQFVKDFKISWLNLGRHLYSIHTDKKYYGWGYNKFEEYTEKELGLKKSVCLKLLKAYLFLEEDEPAYLSEQFTDGREPSKVPTCEQIDVLRLAKSKKEILREDYQQLRSAVFEHGKDAAEVRKDLTMLMKERKNVDPEEERDRRSEAAIRKVLASLKVFQKDMDALKLVDAELIEEICLLSQKLEEQLS
jgi:hypothetical protein